MNIFKDIQKRKNQKLQKQHNLLFAAENIFNRHDPLFIKSRKNIS
jgi:hypothetical protein